MSSPRLPDVVMGAVVATVMVAVAWYVGAVILSHAEEHGHYPAVTVAAVECAERPEAQGDASGEGQDAGVRHGPFFATRRLSDAVRRCRTGSDCAQ